jgi:flagellar basal-body rod protein FlgB
MPSDIQRAVLVRALDALHQRQLALAQNVASIGLAEPQMLRVNFEQALAAAAGSGSARQVASSPIRVERDAESSRAPRLDLEVSKAQENAARYGAVLAIIDRQLQLQHMALNDGRSR